MTVKETCTKFFYYPQDSIEAETLKGSSAIKKKLEDIKEVGVFITDLFPVFLHSDTANT